MLNGTLNMGGVLLITVILLAVICGVAVYTLRKKAYTYVEQTSFRYRDIRQLNASIEFHALALSYTVTDRLKSKTQFDTYQYDKKMVESVAQDYQEVSSILHRVRHNRKVWKLYRQQLQQVDHYLTKKDCAATKIPYFIIRRVEERCCEEELLTSPVLSVIFYQAVGYTSPKGRNSYHRTQVYDMKQMTNVLKQVINQLEYKKSAQYQRSLLKPSMRYEVLTRDGHACQICGRGVEHGVVLHVDHIKPVSKGGLTVMINLRTLCQDCNLGKSARYNPGGLN